MATIGGRATDGVSSLGWYRNGFGGLGDNTNFTWGSYQATGGPNDRPYLRITGGNGSTAFSSDFVEVDPSHNYQAICYVKTFSADSAGNLAGGHLGFATYDEDYNFIDLRHCGGIGNTTLSRDLAVGDDKAYITSNTGWYDGSTYYFKTFCLYPANSDYANNANGSDTDNYGYTRVGLTEGGLYTQNGGPVSHANGDFEVDLKNASNGDITMPDLGYGTMIAGTPVMNGRAGGTYNYAMGAPNYPTTWTQKSTGVFTGESRNSGTPFRYATKYIKFMILRNYNQRTGPNDCVWGISNIFFGRVLGNTNYANTI